MSEFEVPRIDEPGSDPEKPEAVSSWMAEEQDSPPAETDNTAPPAVSKPAPVPTRAAHTNRKPDGVILIAIYHFLCAIPAAVVSLALTFIIITVSLSSDSEMGGRAVAIATLSIFLLFSVIAGIISLITGFGLLKMQNWARWLAIAQAMLSLLNFPIGTIISGIIILYLFAETTQAAFYRE